MTGNQIAKQQADAATEQAKSSAKQARSSASQARTASRKQREDKRHNKEMEAIQGAAAGAKAATDTLKTAGTLGGMLGLLNDVDWYKASDRLLESTCNKSFNASLGTRYASDISMIPGNTIPGVMNIRWSPMLPAGNATNNAVNKAAYSWYAYIRYANSGSRNYTASDLMEYVLAMDSIYALYAQCTKFYAISRAYDSVNRYLPNGLGYTDGFLQSIRQDPAAYRTRLNLCAKFINSWYVPNKLSLFQRHMFMSSLIFADANSRFAQLYNFTMTGAWMFKETSPKTAPIPGAGSLQFVQLGTNVTAIGWLSMLEDMIDALLKIEDIGIISGDILKVYGADVFKVSEVPEDLNISIVYHPEMLTQIENMVICGEIVGEPYIVQYEQKSGSTSEFALKWFNSNRDAFGSITENYPLVAHAMTTTSGIWDDEMAKNDIASQYINLPDDKLSAGDVMVATRLKAILNMDTQDSGKKAYYFKVLECGTEIINSIEVVYDASESVTGLTYDRKVIDFSIWCIDSESDYASSLKAYAYLSSFDWCPQVIAKLIFPSSTGIQTIAGTQDLRRIAKLELKELSNMNVVAFTKEIGLADADARADKAKRY